MKKPPAVEVTKVDPRRPNPQNPCDGLGPSGRWHARVEILGTQIARSSDDIIRLGEMEKEVEMSGDKLMSPREVWEYLSVSESTFWRWLKKAGMRRIKIGNVLRFRRSDIEEALNRCEDGTPRGK